MMKKSMNQSVNEEKNEAIAEAENEGLRAGGGAERASPAAGEHLDPATIAEATIATLKQQLEQKKAELQGQSDTVLRARAELDNVRRRAERDVSNAHKYALDRFVPELLPLIDGLEQGVKNLQAQATEAGTAACEGLMLSLKLFEEVLRRFGVEILEPLAQPFNPAFHEAILMQPTAETDPGLVLTVVQRGYVLGERVLRPARVIVSKSL
jgi:molecular chaperone GrpE